MTLLGQEIIKATSKTLPNQPGVYQMQDDKGNILYIGKAKVLSNRVKNYLSLNNLTKRIQSLRFFLDYEFGLLRREIGNQRQAGNL